MIEDRVADPVDNDSELARFATEGDVSLDDSDLDVDEVTLTVDPPADTEPAPKDADTVNVPFTPPPLEGITPTSGAAGASETQPKKYSFVIAEPRLNHDLQRVLRRIFAKYGNAGLDRFEEAIPDRGDLSAASSVGGGPARQRAQDGEGLPPLESLALFRRRVGECRADLARALDPYVARVQEVATQLVDRTVTASMDEVKLETRRYFVDQKTGDIDATLEGAFAFNASIMKGDLTGPDVADLARAIVRLDDARYLLDAAKENRPAGQAYLEYLAVEKLRWLLSAVPRLSKESENKLSLTKWALDRWRDIVTSQDDVPRRQARYVIEQTNHAARHPVLYRCTAVESAAAECRPILSKYNARRDADHDSPELAAALARSKVFREAIVRPLVVTYQAAKRIKGLLPGSRGGGSRASKSSGFEVWQYPPLVRNAADRLNIPEGTVEAMRMAETAAAVETSWVSELSDVCGLFQMAADSLKAPVLPVANFVGLLFASTEWVKAAWKGSVDLDVFRCTLSPAKTFASEPSMLGLYVSTALLLLQAGML